MWSLFLALCLVVMLPAAVLLRRDVPVLIGGIQASGAWELRGVKVLVGLLLPGAVVAAMLLRGGGVDLLLPEFSEVTALELTAVGLSTLAAVFVTAQISPYTSVQYAFVGAVLGLQLNRWGTVDMTLALRVAAAWLAAPVVCGLLAAGICRLAGQVALRRNRHLALQDRKILRWSVLASLLVAGAFGWNNSVLPGLFPSVMMENRLVAAAFAAGAGALVFPFCLRPLQSETWRISDKVLDIHPVAVFSLLAAMGLSLLAFHRVPLSPSALLLGGLCGAGADRGKTEMEAPVLVRSLAATTLAPVLGLLFCYSFNLNALVLLGLIACVTAIVIYTRAQQQKSLREAIMRSREQQIYSNQKSLSALEVRSEMTEKDLLHKLEARRQELVDFAVGVSEQKEFMEGIYDQLSDMRRMEDPAEKDRRTDEILSSLRERMYFTREMNDFYARSEILHKDFNLRLKEAYPSLTESERKLANLLRQGFSSKYIATLMNITPKSVEINRYRLRSKLGLQRSDNLVQFIKSI
ncbi:MAG: hypothetical protein IJ701_03245 [Bacteroidales bacterium]|nr:hypothetical protein [Bacteroidales bacterium]